MASRILKLTSSIRALPKATGLQVRLKAPKSSSVKTAKTSFPIGLIMQFSFV